MKMEQTECSETSAYKLQTPGNYPKESMQHTHLLCVVNREMMIPTNVVKVVGVLVS